MEKNKTMKIIIDIGHPAHIHYFRNFAKEIESKGGKILFTTREKEMTIELLNHYGFAYISFGKPFKHSVGKIFGLLWFTFRVILITLKFKPDLLMNGSPYSAIAAWLFMKPHISIEDTYNNEQVNLYKPFTSAILTGNYPHPGLGKKEVTYSGYQELFYLHPAYFTPDISVLEELGVFPGERYFILRFVSWGASHDIGHRGIAPENKIRIVKELTKLGKVFITSEKVLPAELETFRLKIPPHRIHHAIAFATLLYGESATMASEAAMLGVPAIFLDNTGRYYTKDEEEKYGLVFNFNESESDFQRSLEKALELISTKDLRKEWIKRRDKMLNEKIDVNRFLTWFVEEWPESFQIMQKEPEYQARFR